MNAIPHELSLRTISRRPTRLPQETIATAMRLRPPFEAAAKCEDSTQIEISIIVVTFNSEVFTRLCIASLLANTAGESYEVIVVDNASSDGTVDFLRSVVAHHRRVRLIFNSENRGFSAANNLGLRAARGSTLVLLNNDTIVPPGWLDRLKSHLRDPAVGMVGPMTNRAQNQAGIETSYNNYAEFLEFANATSTARHGECFESPMLIMFAVAMRREVLDRVGLLDESFGIGMFEDDDYSLRVKLQGYRLVSASDAFVHHFGQGSFGELAPSGDYQRLFAKNRNYFEQKWGQPWQPHQSRETPNDHQLQKSIVAAADTLLPANDRPIAIAVISRGDQRLVDALSNERRVARHFPHEADGSAVAYHPASGLEAMQLVLAEHMEGTAYLIIPKPYLWWLEFYREMAADLSKHCKRHAPSDGSCVIYDLSGLNQKAGR